MQRTVRGRPADVTTGKDVPVLEELLDTMDGRPDNIDRLTITTADPLTITTADPLTITTADPLTITTTALQEQMLQIQRLRHTVDRGERRDSVSTVGGTT